MKLTNKIVIEKAKELGFDLIGFSKVEDLEAEIEHLKKWLDSGYQASMNYMERNFEKRKDAKNILPSAKSVISLGINYYKKDTYENKEGSGKISKYAWGKDYHLIIWEKLEHFENILKEIDPAFECLSYVDTGPVMDKAWAVRSGIGWLGKHTNVITKEMGSWIFLATVITNTEFDYNQPMQDFCGTCTACIEACPTDAIVNEYVVDSNRCISFLTIENKGEISSDFKGKFVDWIFGCDICQDVCPWNQKFSKPSLEAGFRPQIKELELNRVANMDSDEFKSLFESSPVKRTKLNGLKRNAEFLSK